MSKQQHQCAVRSAQHAGIDNFLAPPSYSQDGTVSQRRIQAWSIHSKPSAGRQAKRPPSICTIG